MLIQSLLGEPLPEITIEELQALTPGQLFDLDVARLVTSEVGPFGTRLGVIVPFDDFCKTQQIIQNMRMLAESLAGLCPPSEKPGHF